MTQEKALDILKSGANVFLTGEPGSGKTFTVGKFVEWMDQNNRSYAVTASTGIAASHLNGSTVHSWTGIGIRRELEREDLDSKIIVGSMRHLMDVNEALEAGAHVPTITPPILRKMVWHPRTIETIAEFNNAWRNRPKKK